MKQTIKVKGMHCKSCEMLISDSLENHPGVKTISASEKKGIVEIEYDEHKIKLEQIKAIIENEGYEVVK